MSAQLSRPSRRRNRSSGGQLLYQFRRPWSDGSTALLLDPLGLLERLATLRWRSAVVPRAAQDERDPEHRRAPGRLTWPTLLRRVFAIDVLVCPRCAGPRWILTAVTEPHAVRQLP